MDKIGHLVMTKSLSGNIHRAHKAALLFGSILPDLLVYTYLEGHTWEATFEQIRGKRKRRKLFLFKTWMDSSLCGRLFYLSA